MLPLYQDGWFTFRFAEDRIIPRFHLECVPRGQCISVFKIEPDTCERLDLLATATVGDGNRRAKRTHLKGRDRRAKWTHPSRFCSTGDFTS
jgi:hypothetical protein